MDEVRTERLVGTRPLLRDGDESPLGRHQLILAMQHWKRHRRGCWVWRLDGRIVALAGLRVTEDGVVVDLPYLADPALAPELTEAIERYRESTNAAS